MLQQQLTVRTRGRGTYDITQSVQEVVARARVSEGLCHVFVHHTSASLIVCENADPDVRADLETFFAELVPDGAPMFTHTAEGPDDMPAHVRSILTNVALTLSVRGGRCDLGTWQGVYLWEHRSAPHQRRVTVTILGG